MRLSAKEKMEVIRLVEDSDLSVPRTLEQLGTQRSALPVSERDFFCFHGL